MSFARNAQFLGEKSTYVYQVVGNYSHTKSSSSLYVSDDNIEMMQDSNTVSLLVEAVKTHMKVGIQ